jgi:hypothetical protein
MNMRHSTAQELIEHHLRASGPCTFNSCTQYLRQQLVPAETFHTWEYFTLNILIAMVTDMHVINDGDGIYEWNYGNRA